MRRWIAVAIKAPLHFQRLDPHRQRHLVDTAVTGYAANAIRQVDAVIKVDKVRQVMNASPMKSGNSLAPTVYHRRQHGLVGKQLGVAGHAGGDGRNTRKAGRLHRLMAVAAVKTDLSNMVLVTERYRLGHGMIERRVSGDKGTHNKDHY